MRKGQFPASFIEYDKASTTFDNIPLVHPLVLFELHYIIVNGKRFAHLIPVPGKFPLGELHPGENLPRSLFSSGAVALNPFKYSRIQSHDLFWRSESSTYW